MRPCARCDRHVKLSESVCPFCGAALVEAAAPAAWGWAVGLAMLGAACGPGKSEGTTEGASSEVTGGSESSTDGATVTSAASGTMGATTAEATTGATTAEATTGASSTGCSSQGCSFIYAAPDGGSGTKDCDPWVQDCPVGEKCMPYSGDGDNSWESLKCVPVMENPGQAGDPCTTEGSGVSGIDSCEVGHMCWNLDPDTFEGTCVKFCTGTPDTPMCDPGSVCTIANDGVLILCLPMCDPLTQDCEGGDLCIPNLDRFICVVDASGDEGQEYDVCEYANACDPGLFCAGPENDDSGKCDAQAIGCCLAFCDVTAPAPQCTSAQDDPMSLVECVSWYEEGMAPPGYENVGVCVVPT